MKKFYFPKFVIVFIGVFILVTASAQNFHLVKDVNTFTDANPNNYSAASGSQSFAVINGISYFTADDGIHGPELWRSDGTTVGTWLVKDINVGTAGSSIYALTNFNSKLLFIASKNNGATYQLWTSDGTTIGTVLIKDSLLDDLELAEFIVINNTAYFVVGADFLTQQLWLTDGTTAGTKMVADFYSSAFNYGYSIQDLTSYNNILYFSMQTNAGGDLWRSDGTSAGTYVVKTVSQGGTKPTLLTLVNGKLYLAVDNSIWASDGTSAGTSAVAKYPGFNADDDYFTNDVFPVIGHNIFIQTSNYQSGGWQLYKYNTDSAVAPQFVKVLINSNSFSPEQMVVVNDSLLFFTAYDSQFRRQLWTTTGDSTSNQLLKTDSTFGLQYFKNLTAIGGKLFFSFYDKLHGYELWSSDGTVLGTKIIKDINPGIYSSNPWFITSLGQSILFNANDGVTGQELWKTDGTAQRTVLVKDINKTSTADSDPITDNASPKLYTVANTSGLIYGAYDDLHGFELWKTDGTAAGTNLTKDIAPGYFSGYAVGNIVTKFKGLTYFFETTQGNDTIALWKTDGTTNGTVSAQNIIYNEYSPFSTNNLPLDLTATDSLLFFAIKKYDSNYVELWVGNDVLPAKMIAKISNLSNEFDQSYLIPLGNKILFSVLGTSGTELWQSDGTATGTKLVKKLNAGLSFYSATNLTVYNNKLYFTVYDGSNNYLWVSDGTATGTFVLKDVQVSTSVPFIISAGKLYFCASDTDNGTELWVTDGTNAGTKLVKDIYAGHSSSSPSNLADVNGALYFEANDGIHGNELWHTLGTDTTTVLVKDITPGPTSSTIYSFVNGNGKLYFSNNGFLWQSNGTDSGTVAVFDGNLTDVTNINGLVAAGDKLYFSAYTYKYGYELYVGEANSTLPVTLLSFTGQWAKKDAQLTWVTTNELNNNHFNVQRSLTGTGFTTIGSVKADGDATTRNTYNYTDVNAASLGSNYVYYRLQQVDNDGKFNYTNIIRLDVSAINAIAIAPNPAQKTANIISSNDILGAEITVTDMGGHIVYTSRQNLNAGTPTPLNISGLAAGVYSVIVQSRNNVKQQCKLVVR